MLSVGLYAQEKGTDIQLKNRNFKRLIDNSISFTVPLLSVEEVHENLDSYVLLDAREIDEYNVSHLPGALYIGYDEVDLSVLDKLDKGEKLLFYCSIGYRSEKIAEKALEMGFKEVYNLYGSIFEWTNKGYELQSKNSTQTNKVHGYNWIWGKWIQNKDYEKVY